MKDGRHKVVAIVAPHFVPSNLAAVHRARLWSLHLGEFGWDPVIVTTHWKYYEEKPEMELLELLPADLKVIRTKAFGTRPIRLVGDIGIRAFHWHRRALCNLAQTGKMDFLHITIPSNFSACLGRLVHHKFGVPYGIDYIDPWVHQFPGSEKLFSRAWGHKQLANILEPWAVKNATLITGINRAYYEGMLQRNPAVAGHAVLAAMPYGGCENDHEYVRLHPRPARFFSGHEGKLNLFYAGALLPKAFGVLERLLESLVEMRKRRPELARQFHLHFAGTGKSPKDPKGFNVRPQVERHGLGDCVSEYPQRIPYLEVLSHLHAASGVLVLGSTEPHYSPSKIFQSIMSRRPVFAMLHEASTAVQTLRASNAGDLVTFTEDKLPETHSLSVQLERFLGAIKPEPTNIDFSAFQKESARETTRVLAEALDRAWARAQSCGGQSK
jgi:hypothetical protein